MIITLIDSGNEQDVYVSGKLVHADYQSLVRSMP